MFKNLGVFKLFFIFLHVLDSFLCVKTCISLLTIRKIRETLENREKHTHNYIANTIREIRKFTEKEEK